MADNKSDSSKRTEASLPARRFRRAFLHIGSPKTGTSSIQGTCFKNRKRLGALGYFYPNNDANHIFFASHFREDPTEIPFHARHGRETRALVDAWNRAQMARFEKDVAASDCHTLILSSEYLPKTSPEKCREMAAYLHSLADEVTVVCYVRHPVSHAASATQQGVKMGFRTLEAAQQNAYFFKSSIVLPKYRDAFGATDMQVRKFDRVELRNQDVVTDFLSLVGLADDEVKSLEGADANSSLSYEATLIADALTRQFPREQDGIWNPERARRVNLMQIRGSAFALDDEADARVRAAAEAEIAFLKAEFGLDFTTTKAGRKAGPEARWSDETVLDIAARLNALALEAQHWQAEVMHHRSLDAERAGKPGKAIDLAREAADLNPGNLQFLKRLCRLLVAAGRHGLARTYAGRYCKLYPDDDRGKDLLAGLAPAQKADQA
ncbi:MAG: tetratricopeptide repeat protein [Alphaproteobacteria bacterium]|nr:MAG: tetratricopeptide repeat protein [Alphaproteobacteria bacterium]